MPVKSTHPTQTLDLWSGEEERTMTDGSTLVFKPYRAFKAWAVFQWVGDVCSTLYDGKSESEARKLFLAVLIPILLFSACHKEQQPQPIPSIEGNWKCLVCINPDQTWSFENGTATQNYSAVGSTVFTNTFHYWVKSDTINFVNLKTDAVSAWKVRFHGGGGVCNVQVIGGMINPIQYLERD